MQLDEEWCDDALETVLFPYPVHCAEVDCFSKVETLVEATVIRSGESDHKLASALVGTIDLEKCKP